MHLVLCETCYSSVPSSQDQLRTYSVVIFSQTLVVTRESDHEYQAVNVFKAVYPLSPLWSLSSNIDHPPNYLTKVEVYFGDAGGSEPGLEDISILWYPSGRKYAINCIAKAE